MVGNKRGEIRKEVILRIIMLLLSALVLFPFLYCVAYSLSDSVAVMTTQITIFPVQPTFKNYIEVLNQRNIFNSFFISIARTILGATYTVVVTGPCVLCHFQARPAGPSGAVHLHADSHVYQRRPDPYLHPDVPAATDQQLLGVYPA